MLFFELFPAFMLIVCIPVAVWLAAMDRQSRQRPIEDQTTRVTLVRRTSGPVLRTGGPVRRRS